MQPGEVWGERWRLANSAIAQTYMEVAVTKQSLVCLAADKATMDELVDLISMVGPYIAALKTHVDVIQDWSVERWSEFCQLAHSMNLLIFEDRKFADIGKISRQQIGGIYAINTWADIVTAHLISGPDVVDGLLAGWQDVGCQGSVLLLAQMSSRGNLLTASYSQEVVGFGIKHEGVLGFIGNGSNPLEVQNLRQMVGQQKMIWTPGVNLQTGDGDLGQRYGGPKEAIEAGSDCVIVGSGIHSSTDPIAAAKAYAEASWSGLLARGE